MSLLRCKAFSSRSITTKTLITVAFCLIVVGAICTLLNFPRALAAPIVSDNFNDNSLDTAKWDSSNLFSGFTHTSVGIAETSQRLEIGPLLQNVSGSAYRGVRTVNTYNFTDAYSFVELVQAAASNTAGDSMFTIGSDTNNYYRLYVSAGTLFGQKKIAGTKTTLFSITYDSTNHRFLRIRHDANTGNVTLDTAPGSSGVPGTWTQRYSETWNSSVSKTAMIFEVKGGTSQVEANAPGTVIFDNFEVASNVPAPTVTSISPTSGTTSGGTSVTITGTGFLSGATVSIGGTAATSVTVVSSTSITATTPAHSAGTVNVVVTNTDSQSGTLNNGYTYALSETTLVSDDFNDNSLDTAKWDSSNLFSGFTNTNVPIAETGQRLEIGAMLQNVSGSAYRGIRTVNTYDFTGGYTYVELVQAPASNTAADAMFTIGNTVTAYYRMFVEAGNLIGQRNIGGTKTTLFTITYDSTNHRFLRIRHDSSTGNVTLDTAPGTSGVPGTWTQRYTETWNGSISTTSIIFEVKGGTWQTEANAPGKVIFDNFHAAVPGTQSSSLPTPINAPRAHPLAPNPHTSVGLFWTYTNASTGRQWTDGTYKVKRCSGASCTPTTVVASGLTNADYQDTGLSANTTYGYRYVANDGADTSDSPTVYVTTLSADSANVQFPNTTYEELLGPLPEMAQVPFAYYNSAATTRAQTMIPLFPSVVPFLLQGTGSITNNTTTITGTNTFFLEQVAANNPTCTNHIMINGVDAGTIASVNSNTSITLSTTWTGGTQTSATISTNVALCGFGDPFSDYLTASELYYYDSPQALTAIYFMTGDPQYLRGAIKASESVFAGHFRLGRNRDWVNAGNQTDQAPSPRNLQFGGLVLLGLHGRNDVWDMLDKYLTDRYMVWIGNYRPSNGNQLYNREQSYMLQFASWFVTAAPDSFPRSDGTTTSANGTITVNGDLTSGRKAHWRDQLDTDVPGLIAAAQSPEGNYRTQGLSGSYAEGDYPYSPGEAQPFMSGLTYDALGYVWRNTRLATATRNSARKQVLKAAANLFHEAYNTNVAADQPTLRWRTGWYFLDGGTRLNPFAFRYGADSSILNNTPDSNMMPQYRQVLPLLLATFGWAYEMSGQTIYKTFGDEMANAAFAASGENTGGTGDGIKAICDSGHYKNYGQCFRSTPKYFAQRLLTPSVLGTPPGVTMPSDITLTGGVNQASLTATVNCTNTPCNYRWSLTEYHQAQGRYSAQPMFSDETALTTKLSGMRPGTYKVVFYALDNLGLEGHGYVNVTVGDGVFPPVVVMHKEGGSTWCTTGTSVTTIKVRAYSAAGRTLSHSFSGTGPKDVGAATITPSGTTGNNLTVDVTNLSAGWWTLTDVVTDSAGASWRAYFMIAVGTSCSGMTPPSTAHNTIPLATTHPNHVLPSGSTSTTLFAAPIDPEGWSGFTTSVTGYTFGPNGDYKMPTALTHSWSQTAGPVTATITNGNTLRPSITGLTSSGTYTFRYTGTDQQGDSVQVSINVTVP